MVIQKKQMSNDPKRTMSLKKKVADKAEMEHTKDKGLRTNGFLLPRAQIRLLKKHSLIINGVRRINSQQ